MAKPDDTSRRVLEMIAFFVALALSAEPDAEFLKNAEKARTDRLETIKAGLQDLIDTREAYSHGSINTRSESPARKLPSGKYVFKSKSTKQEYIARNDTRIQDCRKYLNTIASAKYLWPELDVNKPQVGKRGSLPPSKILQVVDDKNMIANVGELYYWIHTDTNGFADDQVWHSPDAFHITGTRRYATAGGASSTVYVLERYASQVVLPIEK